MLDGSLTDLIFENYDGYLNDHRHELGTPTGAVDMLASDGTFNAYISKLTEGMEPYQKAAVTAVCDRERHFLLEESTQLGPSASIIGYAVTYFPILADIYADPNIAQTMTIYPTNKSINTIPKVNLKASVRSTDGTVKTWPMPRAQYLIRGALELLTLAPNVSNDLFQMSAGYPNEVNSTLARINKSYFLLYTIEIKTTDVGGGLGDTTTTWGLNLRPDARGQLHKEFEFTNAHGQTVTGSLVGHIDWDRGTVQFSCAFSQVPGYTFSVNQVTSKVVFSPKTGEVGRVKVEMKISGWDKILSHLQATVN